MKIENENEVNRLRQTKGSSSATIFSPISFRSRTLDGGGNSVPYIGVDFIFFLGRILILYKHMPIRIREEGK